MKTSLTFNITQEQRKLLKSLAKEHSTTQTNILKKALNVYNIINQETNGYCPEIVINGKKFLVFL